MEALPRIGIVPQTDGALALKIVETPQTDEHDGESQLSLRLFARIGSFAKVPPDRALWRELLDLAIGDRETFDVDGHTLNASYVYSVGLYVHVRADRDGIMRGFGERVIASDCRIAKNTARRSLRVLCDLRIVRKGVASHKRRQRGPRPPEYRLNLGGLDWPAVRARAAREWEERLIPIGSPGDPIGESIGSPGDPLRATPLGVDPSTTPTAERGRGDSIQGVPMPTEPKATSPDQRDLATRLRIPADALSTDCGIARKQIAARLAERHTELERANRGVRQRATTGRPADGGVSSSNALRLLNVIRNVHPEIYGTLQTAERSETLTDTWELVYTLPACKLPLPQSMLNGWAKRLDEVAADTGIGGADGVAVYVEYAEVAQC